MAQVSTTIELEGGKVIKPFTSLTLVQAFFQHHYFELRCPATVMEDPSEPLLNDSLDTIGKSISIRFKNLNVEGAVENVFKGIVTNVAVSKSNGAMGDVVISGFSPTILLEDCENCASFSEMSLSQIINKVLEPYPKNDLKTQIKPEYKGESVYRVQYNENAFAFLRRLATMFGEWFFYDGETLAFGKPSSPKRTELYFGRDLSSFHLDMKVAPNNFKHIHYNMFDDEVIVANSSSANPSGLDTFGKRMVDTSRKVYGNAAQRLLYGSTKDSSDRLAFLRKSRQAAGMVSFHGQSDNAGIRLGNQVEITGVRGTMNNNLDKYGTYLCYSITHSIDGSGYYTNSFEAVQKDLEVLFPAPEFPYCEAQLAVVKDVDDPEKLGRVKVQFQWQKGDETTPFIRVMMGHAGQDRGIFFVPEKDEQVIVHFRENKPDYPIVAGSLFHGKAKPYDQAVSASDNNFKSIRTRSGNEIIFCDEAGKEYLVIANKDQMNLMKLDLANSQITIQSQGHIQVEADTITMQSYKDFNIEAGGKLSIKSREEMTLATESVMKQEAMENIEISASSNLIISAMQDTTVKAGMNLSLQGSAKAELKGVQTAVEGSAQATVKAAMVMIN